MGSQHFFVLGAVNVLLVTVYQKHRSLLNSKEDV
jgi:hypothetical protein